MIEIYTNGQIKLDGENTDYGVSQTQDGTRLRRISTDTVIGLPYPRYSLVHENPASGVPGIGVFESHFRMVTK